MKPEKKLFNISKPVVAMIHVSALPGTPNNNTGPAQIIELAVQEAVAYKEAGVDVIAIENMHDVPYLKRGCGPEIVSMMAVIGKEVKAASQLPCGMQILAGANKEALAAANSAGMDFIRAEGFVFAHVGDEGIFESDAGELLRYRKQIGAGEIKIFTDIKKKHSSHALTEDVNIVETARAAEFFLSDGIIITGNVTGEQPDEEEVKQVSTAVDIPVILGSGINIDNVADYFNHADAFIIGTHFKKNNSWQETVDNEKVTEFMKRYNEMRSA
jgi:membrane complex biogenesis BtpA family protein